MFALTASKLGKIPRMRLVCWPSATSGEGAMPEGAGKTPEPLLSSSEGVSGSATVVGVPNAISGDADWANSREAKTRERIATSQFVTILRW